MVEFENAHGLVIGIANYRHIRPLPEAVRNDAREVKNLLTNPDYCGYPAANIRLLLDGEATAAELRAAFADLAARTNADSNVFVYLSCHGGQLANGAFEGAYLLPVDTIYTPEPKLTNALSTEELTGLLNAIPARKLVVVLDCCHAGGLTKQGLEDLSPEVKALSPSDYQILLGGRARAILAASRSTESAWVMNAEHSLFTNHMLAGLRGDAASEDGFIRIFALFNYIQKQVSQARSDQHPILKFEGEEDFPLALYRGGTAKNPADKPDGFLYQAYLSFAEADEAWVYSYIVPKLVAAGVSLTSSADSAFSGIPRIISMERGIADSRRTIAVLSKAYVEDNPAEFTRLLAQTEDIKKGKWSLIPIKIEAFDESRLPGGLSILQPINVSNPDTRDHQLERLALALKQPLPSWRS